jgi:peroxiredoxin family protein
MPVAVFATMDGLEAFDRERVEAMDFEMGSVGRAMMEAEHMDMSLFHENLARAKELGDLEVYACELSMDALEKSLDDYVDVFDDVLGVSGFLTHAQDKQVIFV